MTMPAGIGVVDTMIGVPVPPADVSVYEFLKPLYMDRESKEEFDFPVEYMFKDVPRPKEHVDDPVGLLLGLMDRHGIERGMIGTSSKNEIANRALRDHPDRLFGSYEVNPNRGMDGVRALRRAVEELGVKAATAFPAGLNPQVPVDDRRFYPIYGACIDLDIPICMCVGVPGPRVPMAPQEVARLDEVCWFFPELKVVMRHGAEPWTDLAVKLMLKWPNLYYSTSAFAPKYYPRAIVDYANTRGADKVLYAGYFPMGLSLDRIFRELPQVPFRDHVWPKFLRANAVRVFGLDR